MRPSEAADDSAIAGAPPADLSGHGERPARDVPGETPPPLRVAKGTTPLPGSARLSRTAPCPHCGRAVDRGLVFCNHCGFRTGFGAGAPPFCTACGARLPGDAAAFCPSCGTAVRTGGESPGLVDETRPRARTPRVRAPAPPRLALLDDSGGVVREIALDREVTVVGRTTGEVRFDDDDTLSPEHAQLIWQDNHLRVRDLGSANGSWLFITAPHRLSDGDVLLVGSQVIRFRRLTANSAEPGRPPRLQAGSRLPVDDDALLEQLRTDGSVRDVLYLSPGRTVLIGREHGDWVFPYDPTMSGRHAEVRSMPEQEAYAVRDVGSRNGVAVLVRGERAVREGERLLLGRKMLRVELT